MFQQIPSHSRHFLPVSYFFEISHKILSLEEQPLLPTFDSFYILFPRFFVFRNLSRKKDDFMEIPLDKTHIFIIIEVVCI